MKTLPRYLRAGNLVLAGVVTLILLIPMLWRVKIFLGLTMGLVVLFKALAHWSEGRPARRRAFFCGVLLAPVLLLGAEVLFAYLDWRQEVINRPLRKTAESDRTSMLVRSEVCSHRLRPSCEYRLWGGRLAIDANGFRSDYDVALRKEPGRLRVMIVGGSTTFGWGLPDGHDVAAHLRVALNGSQQGGSYEVINAAVPFYTSYHELSLYQNVLNAYHPDVVITLHGRNDVHFALDEGADWRPVWGGRTGARSSG